MATQFMITGIYDQDTLKFLKEMGLSQFGFNFSPRSFNFLQEYILFEQLLPQLDFTDQIYLFFDHNLDPMWKKIYKDLSVQLPQMLEQVTFVFNEWRPSSQELYKHFMFNYHSLASENFKTENLNNRFLFEFSTLEKLHFKGQLNSFIGNFYLRFPKRVNEGVHNKNILLVDWDSHFMASLVEYLDIEILCLPINRKVEICYRNVNLKLLKKELTVFFNNL